MLWSLVTASPVCIWQKSQWQPPKLLTVAKQEDSKKQALARGLMRSMYIKNMAKALATGSVREGAHRALTRAAADCKVAIDESVASAWALRASDEHAAAYQSPTGKSSMPTVAAFLFGHDVPLGPTVTLEDVERDAQSVMKTVIQAVCASQAYQSMFDFSPKHGSQAAASEAVESNSHDSDSELY